MSILDTNIINIDEICTYDYFEKNGWTYSDNGWHLVKSITNKKNQYYTHIVHLYILYDAQKRMLYNLNNGEKINTEYVATLEQYINLWCETI